jgi:hypothetical protein
VSNIYGICITISHHVSHYLLNRPLNMLLLLLLTYFTHQLEWADRGTDILDNCLANVRLNSSTLKFDEAKIHIRELDWKTSWPPPVGTRDASDPRSSSVLISVLIVLLFYCASLTIYLYAIYLNKIIIWRSCVVIFMHNSVHRFQFW